MTEIITKNCPYKGKREILLFLLILTVVFTTAGCSLYTPETREALPAGIPAQYSMYSDIPEKSADREGRWWLSFESRELNRLISKALSESFTIREARARMEQAGAGLAATKSSLWPQASVGLDYSRTETETESNAGLTVETGTDDYSLGLSASYEVDLWGRIRAENNAGTLSFDASAADLETSAMTVAAEIAETWSSLVSTQIQLDILSEQIRTNENMLKIQELRFEKSIVTALDVLTQREALESTRSRIAPLESAKQVLLNTLSVLVGEPPGYLQDIETRELPVVDDIPGTGLPADLLSMRPDVRAAGLRLKAADWEVAAAKADRLPALSISGTGIYSGSAMNAVFDNWALNLAAGITGPIFDGGARKAEVERAAAEAKELLATYEKTVFNAVLEVENGMVQENKQKEYIEALEREREASAHAVKEAERRYFKGLESFITLLTEQKSLQELEISMAMQRAALVEYRIELYRALGGGWTGMIFEESAEKAD